MTHARTTRRPALRRAAIGGLGAVALLVTAAGTAHAATSSTTVTPAGDAFQASLASGTTADFQLGNISVSCGVSVAQGSVPADNTNPAGPVSSPLSDPTFTNCSSSLGFLVQVTVQSNHTNGAWAVSLQNDAAGSTATLQVPQGGVVVQTSGLASCTIVVAPDGAAPVAGSWTNGSATAPSKLAVNGASLPVKVSGGFFCPSAASATFTASYDVTDTTDSTRQITVGA